MRKSLPALLPTLIWAALYHQPAMADLVGQCMLGVPQFTQPVVTGDTRSLPVTIESDESNVNYPHNAVFNGGVRVTQGNRTLLSDSAILEQTQSAGQADPIRTVTATGNVRYSDNLINLKGPKAWSNLNTKDTDVYQGAYQMVGRQGRGQADKLKVRDNNRYAILDNGTFTSCLPGDNSWSVVGSEVIHDNEEDVVEIWNARFKIGPVPVFYSPYLQLPVGDKRRSGFLIPNARYSSNNGVEFSLPYYWNIAPNYDATLTHHYISKRGMQWQTEMRYLTQPGYGVMALDWLPSDDLYREGNPDEQHNRWLLYWGHSGVMDKHWRFNVNYTRVSDYRYLNDLETVYGSSTDGYSTQQFSVGYAQQNWDANLSSKRFQVFALGGNPDAYRAEPQLDINYYQHDIGPLDFHLYGQVTKFTSEGRNNPEATRWHAEPTLNLPLSNRWGSLNNEVKLIATHYQQDIPTTYQGDLLKKSVDRVMPQFKVDGKMVFERDMTLLNNFTQTLEPRAQYLYLPPREQSEIGLYDTTLLQSDYTGIFRDRVFSGLDRIASANQVSTGITSRIYDDKLDERFNASVGQIYYFNPSRTTRRNQNVDNTASSDPTDTGSLSWAADTYWKINRNFGARGGVQYDTRTRDLSMGNGVIEYRQDSSRVLQLNYRYASADYITAMLPGIQQSLYREGISQVGAIAGWPVADRWSLVGAYYYDTKRQQKADTMLGIQYNTCCWALRMGYERSINDWDSIRGISQYDNKYSFNIELRGLGSNHSSGTQEMLRSGILPYQRAF